MVNIPRVEWCPICFVLLDVELVVLSDRPVECAFAAIVEQLSISLRGYGQREIKIYCNCRRSSNLVSRQFRRGGGRETPYSVQRRIRLT